MFVSLHAVPYSDTAGASQTGLIGMSRHLGNRGVRNDTGVETQLPAVVAAKLSRFVQWLTDKGYTLLNKKGEVTHIPHARESSPSVHQQNVSRMARVDVWVGLAGLGDDADEGNPRQSEAVSGNLKPSE
ncbi:hypothetical protein C8R46DRAFT_1037887 [Mycena filopes]|nr:hypothetical protein C8R46DRAFT_1037887 [Mycena filopes]